MGKAFPLKPERYAGELRALDANPKSPAASGVTTPCCPFYFRVKRPSRNI